MVMKMIFVWSAVMTAIFLYMISKGEGGLLAWIGLAATVYSAFNAASYITKYGNTKIY